MGYRDPLLREGSLVRFQSMPFVLFFDQKTTYSEGRKLLTLVQLLGLVRHELLKSGRLQPVLLVYVEPEFQDVAVVIDGTKLRCAEDFVLKNNHNILALGKRQSLLDFLQLDEDDTVDLPLITIDDLDDFVFWHHGHISFAFVLSLGSSNSLDFEFCNSTNRVVGKVHLSFLFFLGNPQLLLIRGLMESADLLSTLTLKGTGLWVADCVGHTSA